MTTKSKYKKPDASYLRARRRTLFAVTLMREDVLDTDLFVRAEALRELGFSDTKANIVGSDFRWFRRHGLEIAGNISPRSRRAVSERRAMRLQVERGLKALRDYQKESAQEGTEPNVEQYRDIVRAAIASPEAF